MNDTTTRTKLKHATIDRTIHRATRSTLIHTINLHKDIKLEENKIEAIMYENSVMHTRVQKSDRIGSETF